MSTATQPTNGFSVIARSVAFDDGAAARRNDIPREANGYVSDELRNAWHAGWDGTDEALQAERNGGQQ